MKNNFIYILIPGIVIALLAGLFVYRRNLVGSKKIATDGETVQEEKSMIEDSGDKMMSADQSRYVEYTSTNLEKSANTRRVLFFYANWCPTCRPADANLKQNVGRIPEDVTVVRVNYNDSDTDSEEEELANRYNISYQHTFVQIDESGNEVSKWNGGQINELLKNIK